MSSGVTVSSAAVDRPLREWGAPLSLESVAPEPGGPWEVEIGFGKGRYLLRRAEAEPGTGFLGIEVARKYHRILVGRARRRGLENLIALHGEALGLVATGLPRGFARSVHVYFPDPWPKARHHRRRLFDPESLDLVTGLLAPGGRLFFATDHEEYGEVVEEILRTSAYLDVRRQPGLWPDGARTNYEAKYEDEGRPILRLVATLRERDPSLHPSGREDVVVAYRIGEEDAR